MAEIRKRITAILSRMKHDTFERDEALALSSKENVNEANFQIINYKISNIETVC